MDLTLVRGICALIDQCVAVTGDHQACHCTAGIEDTGSNMHKSACVTATHTGCPHQDLIRIRQLVSYTNFWICWNTVHSAHDIQSRLRTGLCDAPFGCHEQIAHQQACMFAQCTAWPVNSWVKQCSVSSSFSALLGGSLIKSFNAARNPLCCSGRPAQDIHGHT